MVFCSKGPGFVNRVSVSICGMSGCLKGTALTKSATAFDAPVQTICHTFTACNTDHWGDHSEAVCATTAIGLLNGIILCNLSNSSTAWVCKPTKGETSFQK